MEKLNITDRASFFVFLRQFLKFGCVGLLNALISILIYTVIIHFNRELYILGNVVAWVITVFISYLLNRRFVFNQTRETFVRGLGKCYVVYFTGLVVSSLLLIFWIEILGLNEQIAQLINIVLMIPANYLLNRFWTFKSPL